MSKLTMGRSPRQPGANRLADRTRVPRSDPRQHVSMLLVIFVILTMVGCSSANEELANEPVLPTQGATNEPVLPTVEAGEPGGPDGLLFGELMLVNRCLYLVNPSGVRWLLVFEADAVSWERDALVLRSERVEIGERISLGGGEVGLSNRPFVQEPHDSCDVEHAWMVSLVIP